MKGLKRRFGLARLVFGAIAALTASNAVAPSSQACTTCNGWTEYSYGEDFYVNIDGATCLYYGVVTNYYYCDVFEYSAITEWVGVEC